MTLIYKGFVEMLRCFSQSELSSCSGILLPHNLWDVGEQLTHPEYGIGTLSFRDDEGRMIFDFPDNPLFSLFDPPT